MNITEKLRDHIESCGITGVKVLQHEAEGEQYKTELLHLMANCPDNRQFAFIFQKNGENATINMTYS